MAPAESPLSHFSIKSTERVRILTAGFGILNPGRRPEYRNTTPGVRIPPGRELRPLQVPRAPGGFS